MDSPPSPRINPYQLCEAPLVLAVVATASQHGVSGRGFVAETGQQDDVGARRREGMSSPLRKASMSGRPRSVREPRPGAARRSPRSAWSMTSGGPTGPGRASRLWLVHTASAGEIRTAVADLLPGRPERPVASTAKTVVAEPAMVRVEIPGKIARHLLDHNDLGETERHAVAGRRRTAGRRRRGPQGIPHLCRPTHRRGDSDRPGAVTSSPVGGMTALLACSRALRGAPE